MSALSNSLKTLLADTVTMYFVAQGFHWNVEGPDFSQYHSLFKEVYEDVYSAIDPLAEDVRKLGEYAPFTLSKFIDLRTVEPKDVKPEPKAMTKELIRINDALIESISKALKEATKADEQGILNFLAERDDAHKMWRWQLSASAK
jgi:starvation-inducible DNA-binding protein